MADEPLGNLAIDHVAFAVHDTRDALRLYVASLGMQAGATEIAEDENLKVTFLTGANARIEILEPLPGDSAVARFLEKRGEGVHHVCLVVPDLPAMLKRLHVAGYQLVDEQPRQNFHGRWLAFVHPKSTNGVMIELYQE